MNNHFRNPFIDFKKHVRAFWNYDLNRSIFDIGEDTLRKDIIWTIEYIDKAQQKVSKKIDAININIDQLLQKEKDLDNLKREHKITQREFIDNKGKLLDCYAKNKKDLEEAKLDEQFIKNAFEIAWKELKKYDEQINSDIWNIMPQLNTSQRIQGYEDLLFEKAILRFRKILDLYDTQEEIPKTICK